jgi:hypothetical protein
LREENVPLAEYVAAILERRPAGERLLLVADQFEELYTLLVNDAALRRRFIDVLLAALTAEGNCKLVLTLRADFMGQVTAETAMVEALQDRVLFLGPMTRAEVEQAIVYPARRAKAGFEAGLVERILEDVGYSGDDAAHAGEAGNLPLLQFALTLLWERQSGGQMTHATYDAIGGVQGALAQHADRVYERLVAQEPALAEQIPRVMVQMVHPGAGAADTRRVATREEVGDAGWLLVKQLADARLVVTDRLSAGNGEVETAEIIHEALIQRWGQLQGWMAADRDFRAWQERLRADRRQWLDHKQEAGYLLQGAPLAVAEAWLAKQRGDLSDGEILYIEASCVRKIKHKQRGDYARARLFWSFCSLRRWDWRLLPGGKLLRQKNKRVLPNHARWRPRLTSSSVATPFWRC